MNNPKIGDFVRLKSGSHILQVVDFSGSKVTVSWYDGDVAVEVDIDWRCLEAANIQVHD